MIIRTVLDITHPSYKHLRLTLLLAASIHHFNSLQKELTMEVWIIGPRLRSLENFLAAFGIRIVSASLSPNAQLKRASNKIPACADSESREPILLLDNDILCTGSLDQLVHLNTRSIMGAEAGMLRVTDAQWEEIEKQTGLRTLDRHYLALKDYPVSLGATMFRCNRQLEMRRLYINSGVLLIPPGQQLREIWEDHFGSILGVFKGHSLYSTVLTGDQTSFATALGEIGTFEWLPIEYNYRPPCFVLGLVPSEQIRLVHLTGGIRHSPHSDNPTNDPALTVTRYLSLYWQSRILTSLETLEADCTEDTIADRRATAEQVQSVGISIAEMYELDAVFAQCAQELASALN